MGRSATAFAQLARLAEALREVRARPLGTDPGRPFELTADRLAQRDHFDLTSEAGDFGCTDWGTEAFRARDARGRPGAGRGAGGRGAREAPRRAPPGPGRPGDPGGGSRGAGPA